MYVVLNPLADGPGIVQNHGCMSCPLAKHQRRTTGIVSVDMSKAFDRARHDLMISDLAAIGVHELVLSWLF